MPAGQGIESQFKFLLACIKHSSNGKVDFNALAQEMGIVSKAAAAKRYERLLKAHNISANGGATARSTTVEGADASAKKAPRPRKRKASDGDMDENLADIVPSPSKAPRPTKRAPAKNASAKIEDDDDTEDEKSLVKDELFVAESDFRDEDEQNFDASLQNEYVDYV